MTSKPLPRVFVQSWPDGLLPQAILIHLAAKNFPTEHIHCRWNTFEALQDHYPLSSSYLSYIIVLKVLTDASSNSNIYHTWLGYTAIESWTFLKFSPHCFCIALEEKRQVWHLILMYSINWRTYSRTAWSRDKWGVLNSFLALLIFLSVPSPILSVYNASIFWLLNIYCCHGQTLKNKVFIFDFYIYVAKCIH